MPRGLGKEVVCATPTPRRWWGRRVAAWVAAMVVVGLAATVSGVGTAAAGFEPVEPVDAGTREPTIDVVCDVDPPPAAPDPARPAGRIDLSGIEHIAAYDIEIQIEHDGTLAVVETIEYDFGPFDRRGILRSIITRQRCNDRYDRVYPLTVESVSSATAPDGYVLESGDGGTTIRIGDPEIYISGRHTYEIRYHQEGVLNGFADHDELYWNVIGHDWDVPIADVTVEVDTYAEPSGERWVIDLACFAGAYGSRTSCDSASADLTYDARFTQDLLWSFEGLSIVVATNRGDPAPAPILVERWSLARAFSLTPATVGTTAALTWLVVGGYALMAFRVGRDRRLVGSMTDIAFAPVGARGVPVPLFEDDESPVEFVPPDRLRPAQLGLIVHEKARPLDVSATIVDLAVRGYLRIEETEPVGTLFKHADYRLVRLDKDPADLLPYEKRLHDGLFGGRSQVTISELRYMFHTTLARIIDDLYDDGKARGWFTRRPDRVRTRWRVGGILVLVASLVALVLAVVFTKVALVALPPVLGGLLLVFGAGAMPRRTPAGTGLVRRALGFERFITDSEAPRARWAEQRNIFSEYLPYAIVLGCADRWADAFEGLDDEIATSTGGWYHGRSPFTTALLINRMSAFSTSAGSTMASVQPSSSGSGGSSGFSGGFSGGGGGGGGGGSW